MSDQKQKKVKRIRPKSRLYAVAHALLAAPIRWITRIHVHGGKNEPTPEQGGCLVICNHLVWRDPIVLCCALKHRQPHFMAKKELFRIPLLNWLIKGLGAFPVDRSTADLNAVRTALRAVQNGNRLLIFPQGTRGGKENAAKNGAAMLAVKTKAPIVPVYIPPNKKFRSRPTIVIGKPYLPEQTRDYEKVSQDLMQRVYELERGL